MCCKSPDPICSLSSRWLAGNFITTQLFQDVYCATAKLYLEQERQTVVQKANIIRLIDFFIKCMKVIHII